MQEPDYRIVVGHEEEGEEGWRVEVERIATDSLILIEERVKLWAALNDADSAIDRDIRDE